MKFAGYKQPPLFLGALPQVQDGVSGSSPMLSSDVSHDSDLPDCRQCLFSLYQHKSGFCNLLIHKLGAFVWLIVFHIFSTATPRYLS